MLPPSWSCFLCPITVMNANTRCTNKAPDYSFGLATWFIYVHFMFGTNGFMSHLKDGVLLIIITSSYIVHFTITVLMRFTLVPWSLGIEPTTFIHLSQLPGEYTTQGNCSAPKAFSYTKSTSTLAGTHLYPWVKVSCLRTQVSKPGLKHTLC